MKIVVFGAKGRVGSAVVKLAKLRGYEVTEKDIDNLGNCATACAKETTNAAKTRNSRKCAENIADSSDENAVDVAIDFSTPQATAEVCEFCMRHRCPLVTGVTGRNEYEQKILDELKSEVKVCESSNFSRGVEYMHKICALLAHLGWDCEIVELHRKNKRDAPGGTAKDLAATIAQNGTRIVTVHSLRAGESTGIHAVIFASNGESITVTHRAENVEIFARGALETAEKLVCLK